MCEKSAAGRTAERDSRDVAFLEHRQPLDDAILHPHNHRETAATLLPIGFRNDEIDTARHGLAAQGVDVHVDDLTDPDLVDLRFIDVDSDLDFVEPHERGHDATEIDPLADIGLLGDEVAVKRRGHRVFSQLIFEAKDFLLLGLDRRLGRGNLFSSMSGRHHLVIRFRFRVRLTSPLFLEVGFVIFLVGDGQGLRSRMLSSLSRRANDL